jgi:hypothetical protein
VAGANRKTLILKAAASNRPVTIGFFTVDASIFMITPENAEIATNDPHAG